MATAHNLKIQIDRCLVITVDRNDSDRLSGFGGWDLYRLKLDIQGETTILHGFTLIGRLKLSLRVLRYIWTSR